MAHDIFISHAQADKAVADLVCATLEQRGIRCWIAPRDIRPGADWGGAIVAAIRQSRAMVLVFSDSANASRHIPRELERAIDSGIPIVPFRIENTQPRGSLEYNLALVHWLDAVSPPLELHANRLADVIVTMLGMGEPRPDPRVGIPAVEAPAPVPNEPAASPPRSPLRMILVIVGALAAAGLGLAWGVQRYGRVADTPAPPTVPDVIETNDRPPSTAAPPPSAAASDAVEPDAKAPDAETAWQDCNGSDANRIIAGCTSLIQTRPGEKEVTGRAFFNRAMVHYAQANYDPAIADFSQALDLGFSPAYSYNNRGLAYFAKKNYTLALADYDQAILANPEFVDAYRNRALANAINRRFQAAIADLSKAISLDENNADLRLMRASAYLLQRDTERALADIATYIGRKPDEVAGYRVRGLGYFQRGLMVLAKEDFARCLKLNGSDAQALYAQGVARELTGDAGGKDDVSEALKIDPTITELMAAFGVVRK